MRKMVSSLRFWLYAASIAAVYTALTMALAPISFGQLQVRVSEALCVLPFFTPAAIPGLFVGCLLSNILGGLGVIDWIFGSLATLLAAWLCRRMPRALVPLPAVIINAFVVGAILYYTLALPFWLNVVYVGIGQVIACYVLGMPLLLLLQRHRLRIFGPLGW